MSLGTIISKNRDNLFSLGATVARAFSRFLLVFLASLLLTKYEFGLFNIFLSIYFFSRLFSENSLNLPFIKFASDGANPPALVNWQVILLKLGYVLAVSLVLLALSGPIVTLTGLERREILLLLPLTLLALTSYMFVAQVLTARIRMRLLFVFELLNCLVFILVMAAAYGIVTSFTTEYLVLIFTVAMAGSAAAGILVFRRFMTVTPRLDPPLLGEIARYSTYTVLSGISSVVILRADVLMLGYFLTPREVAVYGMAVFVNEAVQVIFDSVLRVCLPRASALSGQGDGEQLVTLFRQSVKNIYIGIVPVVAVIAVAAPTVIHLVYQGKYDDSLPLVYLFLASSAVKPVGYVAGIILGATGNIRLDNRNCWIAAVLNIVCNLLLIPRFGVMGAATASILSFIALSVLHYHAVRKAVFNRKAEDTA
ncbi:MAG: hypothetical protein Kow0089_00490 [Desulfobulbaceae bacterium]